MARSRIHPLYPLFLNIRDEAALVIGAGRVAERKIRALLECGARVTVVAPAATAAIRRWATARRLVWLNRTFRVSDMRHHRLIFCATDHLQVDRRAADSARRRGLLVNCASQPELGSFTLPVASRAGRVQVAVSTGGASPHLARRISRDLAARMDSGYASWADLLAELRPVIAADVPRQLRVALWDRLTSGGMARVLRGQGLAAARRHALRQIARATRPKLKS